MSWNIINDFSPQSQVCVCLRFCGKNASRLYQCAIGHGLGRQWEEKVCMCMYVKCISSFFFSFVFISLFLRHSFLQSSIYLQFSLIHLYLQTTLPTFSSPLLSLYTWLPCLLLLLLLYFLSVFPLFPPSLLYSFHNLSLSMYFRLYISFCKFVPFYVF